MSNMQPEARATLGTIALAVAAVACLGVSAVSSSSHGSTLHDQQQRIATYNNDIDVAKQASQSGQQQVDQAVTGVDPARKKADDDQANQVLSTATTWNSLATYNQARDKLARLGVNPKSQLLTGFLAPVQVAKLPNGQTSNPIDASGANMAFQSADSQVSGIDGSTYTYLTLVQVGSKSTTSTNDGSGATANGWMAATYTTGADHKITDVDLEPLLNQPQ